MNGTVNGTVNGAVNGAVNMSTFKLAGVMLHMQDWYPIEHMAASRGTICYSILSSDSVVQSKPAGLTCLTDFQTMRVNPYMHP